MSKITEVFNFARSCPQLTNLFSIGAPEDVGIRVILPQGASEKVHYQDHLDVYGNYECDIIPYPSVYEDYHINCFQILDPADNSAPEDNLNTLRFDEVQSVCDWIEEQNENRNLPVITGEKVVSVECYPPVPQIRYANPQEGIVAYFITLRIRYVNRAKRKSIRYELEN